MAVVLLLLVGEALVHIAVKKKLRIKQSFKIKSNRWSITVLSIAAMSYSFTFQSINTYAFGTISFLFLWGAFNISRTRYEYLAIEEDGVWDLEIDKKIIDPSTVTTVRFLEAEIAIDTTKYRNDLVIMSNRLKSPKWEELVAHLVEMEKRWK